MINGYQNLYDSRNVTTHFSWIISHLRLAPCYDQPINQISSFYLHLLRKYERRYKISKMGGLGSLVMKVTDNSTV